MVSSRPVSLILRALQGTRDRQRCEFGDRARALETARKIKLTGRDETIAGRILHEIIERLEFLSAVGLGYLSLGRSPPESVAADLPSDK